MTAQLATLIQNAIGPDFRVDQELDGGGMSRLFLATDLRHDRRVVVKVLSPDLMTQQSAARFKREIELTVRLQHPHILPILTSGAWEDTLYYITPFIPGESLKARIARDGKLPLDDILKILRDVSGALAFAHSRGIVHRDIKPGNILLADGHAILADFGIARAVSTTATPLTGSGMVPGTPAYMAPELPTDERADVYALGVVAYEMLCGALPRRGATAKEIIATRGKVAGDSSVPLQSLAAIVSDALSPAPDRRLRSVQEVVERLGSSGRTTQRTSFRLVVGIAALVVAASVVMWAVVRRHALDPDKYVVLATTRDSLGAVDALGRAFAEWRGVTLVDPAEAASAGKRSAGRVGRSEWQDIARRFRARNLVAVDVAQDGDSVALTASIYDASGDSTIRTKRIAYPRSATSADRLMAMRRLSNDMLRDGDELPWSSAADDTAPSLVAWRQFDQGRQSIARWDLSDAEHHFRAAIDDQARVAPAYLWLAQTMLWLGAADRLPDVRAAATHALERHGLLNPRDSLHARGVLALASKEFPQACESFAALAARDSNSVVAWIGRGDCNAFDRAVIEDHRAPTGRVFRGSFETAARSYQRAADLGPASRSAQFQGWLLGRLSRVLFSVTNLVRTGTTADSINYAALPSLDHDTLAFHPITMDQLSRGEGSPSPQAVQLAVNRNLILMRRAAEEWVRRAPNDPVAYDSLAVRVEIAGGMATIGERQVTSLQVAERALALATDSTERLHLGITRVRLLVKDGKFENARVAAESLLSTSIAHSTQFIDGMAGLAVLVGHRDDATRLLARDPDNARVMGGRGGVIVLSRQVADLTAALTVRAALGLGGDSTLDLAKRLDDLIGSYYAASGSADAIRRAIVPRALAFVYPTGERYLAGVPSTSMSAIDLFQALARGDTAYVRRALRSNSENLLVTNPGTSVDLVFLRAQVSLRVHDTTDAVAHLDPILRALPTLAPTVLWQVTQTGALVRAFALRAEIAHNTGDRRTAMECASAVISLWLHADPDLQPVVQRMKTLAAAG